MQKKRWLLKQADPQAVETLAKSCGVSAITAAIMATRGLDAPECASAFLAPSLSGMLDPFLLAGMEQAVQRLLAARSNNERICIYGDYDVDGISSTALLVLALRELGFAVGYFIPNRMDDGYGLNGESLRTIRSQGYQLVISVDCGVTAVAEARLCNEIGLDLIITDHHQPLEQLPEAVAVINPHRPDCTYPFKGLAGVGVAFNLLVALRSRLRDQGVWGDNGPDLRQWLDLVALGTVADLVPLVDQNRMLVAAGLARMGQGCRVGLAALKKVAGIKGTVSCGQVGFQLAPRLNAAGRLESAVPGVELLLSNSYEQALILAEDLDAANRERRELEQRMFEQAVAMVEATGGAATRHSLVLSSPDWHQGVVGIVASRLVERYYRPTILIAEFADGSGKGSGRSITGFHLLEALHASADQLERYGGHRAAAGVTVTAGGISAFRDAFERAAAARLSDTDLVPELTVDVEASAAQLDLTLVRELQRLAPFGMGNPEPVLLLRNCRLRDIRVFGGTHIKLQVQQNSTVFQAIGWRMADETVPQELDLAFVPEIDNWGGTEKVQLRLKAIRPTEVCCAA